MSIAQRQVKRQKVKLTAEELAMENPHLEHGLELLAWLLMGRWEEVLLCHEIGTSAFSYEQP